METKLLPCPFCGTKDNQTYQDTDGTWGVQCYTCSVWLGEAHDTEAEATEAWNTRATDYSQAQVTHCCPCGARRTVTLKGSGRCPDCNKLVGKGERYCAWCGARVKEG